MGVRGVDFLLLDKGNEVLVEKELANVGDAATCNGIVWEKSRIKVRQDVNMGRSSGVFWCQEAIVVVETENLQWPGNRVSKATTPSSSVN